MEPSIRLILCNIGILLNLRGLWTGLLQYTQGTESTNFHCKTSGGVNTIYVIVASRE